MQLPIKNQKTIDELNWSKLLHKVRTIEEEAEYWNYNDFVFLIKMWINKIHGPITAAETDQILEILENLEHIKICDLTHGEIQILINI